MSAEFGDRVKMEEALLLQKKVERRAFVVEFKKVSFIAIPMVVVTVSQHLLRVVAMMMVGHLSELSLSGAAIATSITNVTGFSLLFGMASALETLCGQAYGAEQYQKLGVYTYAAIISLIAVCVPISVLWIFMDKLLIFIGQDPLISTEAGRYSTWLIATLVPYAILQAQVRYLQTQSLILPMLLSSIASLCFHVLICWALVFKINMGSGGAALAIGLSYWVNVILLGVYVRYSSSCKKTLNSVNCFSSKDVFTGVGEFFRLAVPSASMVCLEWWTSEIIVLLSGLLPNPQLETSVLSVCLLIASMHYFVPFSIGAGASTRVSNQLGAGNAEAARAAVWAALLLTIAEAIIANAALLGSSRVLGYAFSNEKAVVDYLREMVPFVCLLLTMDCIQAVLSGVARGSGWQHLGAYVNLGAFYLVGMPVAIVLGFVVHLKGKGLWIGLNSGATVQSLLLCVITCFTDWQKQGSIARERIFHGGNP
nr:protein DETOXIFICATION 14-like [Ipomoea batatas]